MPLTLACLRAEVLGLLSLVGIPDLCHAVILHDNHVAVGTHSVPEQLKLGWLFAEWPGGHDRFLS